MRRGSVIITKRPNPQETPLALEPVNQKLVGLAIAEADTATFERFGQAFYAQLIGRAFVPLGGMHDGGAEGYLEPGAYEDQSVKHFLQISKQKTYEKKIRDTVKRLREFGRSPNSLTYITSLVISHIDKLEEDLTEELGCLIRVRDGKYIESHINDTEASISAFEAYLRPAVAYLLAPGAANIAPRTSIYTDRTLAVFLRQEVENRGGKTELLDSVADSLIIWALSDTDPLEGKFMTRDEVLERIELTLPSAKRFMRGVIDVHLERLKSKTNTDGRQIRYYSIGSRYCLPYETRQIVAQENLDDEDLKLAVTASFIRRFDALAQPTEDALLEDVISVCHSTIERIFEKQGLEMAQFVTDSDLEDDLFANAADIVAALLEESPPTNSQEVVRRLSIAVLRGTFYDTTDEEREYLRKLSHTYVLLLVLKNEPKVVEYFKSISGKFNLYIGTDFLVRALSEHYLSEKNQVTQNIFKILKSAGSKLILTEKAVEELATHIRSQIYEFEHVYQYTEHRVTLDMVDSIDRILIRSYFYSKLAPLSDKKPPKGWRSYVEQFAPYGAIKSHQGDQDLARYLTNRFGFVYETSLEMEADLEISDVNELASDILKIKAESGKLKEHDGILAYNDALQVYRIYKKRRQNGETSPANPFGFSTWWLTQDVKVKRAAAKLVAKNYGQRFLMRPEFLLNFISMSPSMKEVLASYRTVFPSVLGVRLSNRVSARTFRSVMASANEIWSVDEARAGAMITNYTNSLKGDSLKRYEHDWG